MHNIIIFGASGHGSVVVDCIEREGKYKIVGFVDSFMEKGIQVNGYTVLGGERDLPFLMEKHQVFDGIIAIGDNWTRNLIVDRIKKIAPKFKYIKTVHPNAEVGKDVQIGAGTVVLSGVIINTNAVIGNHCILNTNASLDHDGFMSNFSSFAPNVCVGANFILGMGSAICLGTNIIENITIGTQTVIGAGSLVVGNFSDYLVAYGAPAKVVRKRIASEPYLSGRKSTSLKKASRLIKKV